jgi:UDP-2,3-diacylglucosamine pyrophosphatase LpxH
MDVSTKIILSDLHLGAGSFGGANPLEDFRHDRQFSDFLMSLRDESESAGRPMDLIINGDFVEYLQVPAVPVSEYDPRAAYPEDAYRSTTEADAVLRTDLVIAGHRPVFEGLAGFLSERPRRTVTVIKGNHDLQLHWPGVQERIRQALGAVGPRAPLLTFAARSVLQDGVYVEHGNQYGDPLNSLDDFENPVDPRHPDRLKTPVGSRFVIEFFNHVEYEKWWVDAVKPIPALIAYGMVLEPAFALKALAVLLTALPGMVFHPFAAGQGEPPPLEAVRTGAVDEVARRYADDPAFRRELDAALGEVLQSIGPYNIPTPAGGETGRPSIRAQAMSTAGLLRALRGFRARVRRLRRAGRPAPPQPDFLEAGQRISRGFSDHLVGAAQQILRERGVSLVVFGHTHQARLDVLQGGVYANSGTWTWWRDFSQASREDWQRLLEHPESFTTPHYLTYVRVDPGPEGHLRVSLHDLSGSLPLPREALWAV